MAGKLHHMAVNSGNFEKTVKFFVRALGYDSDSAKQIEASLEKFENQRWQRVLQPVYVLN